MEKKLYKSTRNRKLAGVCGGLGEYFNIDPTIVRLILVVLMLACGTGLLAYIIAALVMDDAPEEYYRERETKKAEDENF